MAWEVRVIMKGWYGDIEYVEDGQTCRFYWEFGGGNALASISVPAPDAWDTEVPWAKGRREEILDRVAAETVRQRAPSAFIQRKDRFINLLITEPPL
jgi:hypothetical protein